MKWKAAIFFGSALAVGDFDRDGHDNLAIGIPGEEVGDGPEGGDYAIWNLLLEQGRLDTDQDEVDYALDNCSEVPNTDQRDTDGDGFGNACDADLNNDCVVNVIDLGLFRQVFFTDDRMPISTATVS
ncbi:MAG: FG-GAP repeat protein [Pseudomonadota bacterium]